MKSKTSVGDKTKKKRVTTKNWNLQKIQNRKSFSTTEVILLVIITLLIGLMIGKLLNNKIIVSKITSFNDKYVNDFIKNYEYITNNYYEEIDKEKLINSAIAGMMESLEDPYSEYFDEEETNNFQITLDGSYKGIGVQITKDSTTGYMIVTTVFDDSPAQVAGLKVGDMIVSINGTLSKDISSSEFSLLVRNSNEDQFKMSVLRNNETVEINLRKQTVELNSVNSKVYDLGNKKIGYIYIGIFANNTYLQFKDQLQKLEEQNINSLIIDVRNNTGGHLTAVDSILDLFLNSKNIMYQFKQNNKITPVYGKGNENKKYELILLSNEISASASEVLIAGLRENLNVTLIGKKTYGKGTVQEMVNLTDGTQYKITVKKWLTPKGNWVNDTEGIAPDIEVELGEKYINTGDENDDNQLQTALQYLKNK